MTRVSAVVPVLNGGRYLDELLAALEREGVDGVLVIDSQSDDDSVAIARRRGARVIEIERAQFQHGATRNMGAAESDGELVCFLTQDATPLPGWLDAYREAFALDDRVGAAFGPHLPRDDTSPMIARELTEFFASFSPDGSAAIQGPDRPPFLSNVNACYRRECLEQVRFRTLDYAEDQAFARDMETSGWVRVYQPRAAVLHAHDYGALEFMRRYFDEYRGLHGSTGHVEPFHPVRATIETSREVRRDLRYLRAAGARGGDVLRWLPRSLIHHGGRRVFSAAGSRAHRLPDVVQRALSLERRGAAAPLGEAGEAAGVPTLHMPPRFAAHEHESIAAVMREGPAELLPPVDGMAERDRLHIATVVPPFRRGSGGHMTLFRIIRQLERMGHTCSVWLDDPIREMGGSRGAVIRHDIREFFQPIDAPVFNGFDDWFGADVVLATGWQTAWPVLRLPEARARAYLVQDHEPEFYATSVESHWARESYRHGLYCIAASGWLRDLVHDRYDAQASHFDLGVDHEVYRPREIPREPETVVFYGRYTTPRRAVALGTHALGILKQWRPNLRVVIFGAEWRIDTWFEYDHVGVVGAEELSALYSQGTVGLSLSMTNISLIPKEMMACGMPVVELSGVSAESVFGEDGPVELAEFDPYALAAALDRLLSDRELWERRSRAGLEFVAEMTWEHAARQVEHGLREALRARTHAAAQAPS